MRDAVPIITISILILSATLLLADTCTYDCQETQWVWMLTGVGGPADSNPKCYKLCQYWQKRAWNMWGAYDDSGNPLDDLLEDIGEYEEDACNSNCDANRTTSTAQNAPGGTFIRSFNWTIYEKCDWQT